MESKKTPNDIPVIVGQAIDWVKKMGLPCRYLKDGDWWEIFYKKTYILIPNDVEDNEIGFITCAIAKGEPDEEICKMVFDFAVTTSKDELKDCDVMYIANGLCQVSQWWQTGGRLKLYKCRLIEKLDELLKMQQTFWIHLSLAYDALFNPPKEILDEIFGNSSKEEE